MLQRVSSALGKAGRIAVRLQIWLTLLFLVLPVFIILPVSFTSGALLVLPTPGWSLRWYTELMENPAWARSLVHSLVVGVSTMFFATCIGTLAALALVNTKSRFKYFVLAVILSPIVIPVVIIAVGIFMMFSPLGLTSSYLGIVLGHTVVAVPFVVITVTATLQVFDKRLVQAGASLGASPSRVFRYITMPLIAPGVASGAIFAFVTSFDDIIIALFVGDPAQRTLPREIFSGIRENISPAIASVAIVLIVMSVCLMIVFELLRARSERLIGNQSRQHAE